jgi:hypothetical protein
MPDGCRLRAGPCAGGVDEFRDYLPYWTPWERVRSVVVVVSVVAVQPPRKIANRPRNVSAIRFFFIVQRKRIGAWKRMGLLLNPIVVAEAKEE